MDDITPRGDYRGERRDFSVPHRVPMPGRDPQPPSQPPTAPAHHQPEPHHPPKPHPHSAPHHPHQIHHQPEGHAHQTAEAAHHPVQSQPREDVYYRPQAAAQPAEQPKTKRLSNLKSTKVIIAVVVLVLGFAAFMAFKPAKSKVVLPADLAKQANFSVYYPNPVPSGFVYDNTIATFTNGQAYFLLNKGTEHIIVREQAWSSNTLDTSSLTNPTPVQIAAGKAAIGTNTGQTGAVVLAGSTLITITSNGSVPPADMTSLISNLKSLGQRQ